MTYLTTPIYYVNDVPHVGHAYTTVLADALARWHRLAGRPVRLITGTDEHGAKVQRAAAEVGVTPAALATTTAGRFRSTWDRLGIGYDEFIRTTSATHRRTVTTLLTRLYEAGHLRRARYDGRYCVACEAYTTRAVCPVHGRPTEQIGEENWFFRLSAFAGPLAEWFDRCPDAVQPAERRNEALGWLRRGLVDFSISRANLTWGIPLPWEPTQVTYVWFDALASYLTAAGWPEPDFHRWWPPRHVIGKDIVRFHAVYWPAILLAAGLPLPERVTVHGFLLQRGSKIAKSGERAVPLDDLIDRFGPEALRYHLLRDNPVGPDGEFSVAAVEARYRADLANTLGNLLSRVTALVVSHHGGLGPAPRPDSPLAPVAAECAETGVAGWEAGQPAEALTAAWRLVAAANAYLVSARPWRTAPGSAEAVEVLGAALEALRIVAVLAAPAIPRTAARIWRQLGLDGYAPRVPADLAWGGYPGGRPVERATPLFPRLTPPAQPVR
ncbi:class I tRNA ligase family protein [Micromonospora sp. HM5-17]|uniref:class I tRNA ligase family protein n=1 Tax=Micromonospora sp. HM5-17 TaxID=2487710 RepID=UPI000F47E734|nr:class I tRNA ligase family protein [Micromonospora sp. HM5-17]ROT32198.1 methionine--tRNA ligase [Micromonospora sp. HM5-17]